MERPVVFSGAKTQVVISWKIWEEMTQNSSNRKSMHCFFICVNLILKFFFLTFGVRNFYRIL